MAETRAEKCRKKAEVCGLNAKSARSAPEEEAWLKLAADWIELAESFEKEDGPQRTNGEQH